ncbi:GDSL-type esterase/lipase family protein [Marinobacterium stanieri]|uniref:Lysophospholipase L1 n=1 Tax=Marinobacterium stanieri TaxID=49186 RepID=A0A1N6ULM1_9GAMM|nr:GDSL-type esterase/lipase family protein [Marinobacterium stanieri]SIQ66437.1 Lysophospholipase L1 [Marinobacterium stanieri]
MKRFVALALVSLSLLTGCSSDQLDPLGRNAVILAFGDSLTVGVGTSEQQNYPAVLSQLTDRQVVASGVSGEVSSQGLQRLPGELERVRPDLLILLHGGNDILRNGSAQTLEQNLEAMINLAQAKDIPVVLVGVPEKRLFSDAAPLYSELAERHDLVFIEDLLADLLRESSMKSDAVHLNEQGYRALAQGIHQALQDAGAL